MHVWKENGTKVQTKRTADIFYFEFINIWSELFTLVTKKKPSTALREKS
jgi:hypothetical protein